MPPRKPSLESSATPSSNGRTFTSFGEIANFLWSIADLLRGTYKQADYGKVILPMTVLRRLDCVLEPTKARVLEKYAEAKSGKVQKLDHILNRITKVPFHNISKLDFDKLKGNPSNIAQNLNQYIKGFSADVRDIFIERFKFDGQLQTLDEKNLLFMVVSRFAEVDLHPEAVSNHTMGLVFEELRYDSWHPGMASGSGWRGCHLVTGLGRRYLESTLRFSTPDESEPSWPPRDTPQPAHRGDPRGG